MSLLTQLSALRPRAIQARGFLATLMLVFLSTSQVPSQIAAADLLEEAQALEAVSQPDAAGGMAPPESNRLERLASDSKLLNSQAILAPFARGEAETAVIVTLEPTSAAHDLATQSAGSLNRPTSFDRAKGPVFYDLQDQTIRTQLTDPRQSRGLIL